MSQTSEIMADLDTVGGIIARAEADLAAGVILDLAPLESHIEALCARIEGLPPGEGRSVQAKLLALADSFGHLGRAIEAALGEVKVLGATPRLREHSWISISTCASCSR
jgi:hypothetical protein